MAPVHFINPLACRNKSKDVGPTLTEKTKASSPTTPMVLFSTIACSSRLESITEHSQDNDDDGHEDSKISEPDNNNNNGSAVVITAVDYKNVLSQWKGKNHEPIVERGTRSSTRDSTCSNNNKSPSPRSVAVVTSKENIPTADSIRKRRSQRILLLQRFKSNNNQTRNASDAPLPTEPEFRPENHSIQKDKVSMVEGGSTAIVPTDAFQDDDSIQEEVLENESSVTIDSSSSPVAVVDEGCDVPLHPAEQSIMVMILKPTASTRLGIQLTCYGWRFVISRIDEAGLLAQTELQVGQTILAINGMAASDFPDPRAMLDALKVSRKVVIVATKSVLFSTTQSAGLVLGKTVWNTVYITQVLVPNSTLRTGMTLIAINRTTNLDLQTANRILEEYQMGQTVRLSILAIPTPVSSEAVSNRTLYVDESCVTAQLLPSCPIELRKHNDWRIIIAKIGNHPKLRVGQTVLAVNGVPAHCFGSAAAMKEMMSRSPALVFATNSILVSVIKPTVDAKVGVAFQQSKGGLRIHQIDPTGSFWGKLKEGMKVIGINGYPCPTTLEMANMMVKVCVGTLTIVAVDDEDDN